VLPEQRPDGRVVEERLLLRPDHPVQRRQRGRLVLLALLTPIAQDDRRRDGSPEEQRQPGADPSLHAQNSVVCTLLGGAAIAQFIEGLSMIHFPPA
jgi:hypothetical protein